MAANRQKRAPRTLRLTDSFEEVGFAPKSSQRDVIGVVVMSIGALAFGSGLYAQFLWRAGEPPTYAVALLVVGAVLIAAYALMFSSSAGEQIYVGDLGVSIERQGHSSRIAWYEVTELSSAHDALVLRTAGKPVTVGISKHTAACRAIVDEADRRIPDRVSVDDRAMDKIDAANDEGEVYEADPPPIGDLVCLATNAPFTSSRDVRLCARCMAPFKKSAVPKKCPTCDATLK